MRRTEQDLASESSAAAAIVEFLDDSSSSSPNDSADALKRGSDPARPSSEVSAMPAPWRHPVRSVLWLFRTTFGVASLILLLAVIAAIPLVNFVVLGYLLEVEGRVARTGRLRQAFPLLGRAPQLGSIVLGVWLWILPLRLMSNMVADARLVDPASNVTRNLAVALKFAAVVVAVHLVLAIARGGSLATFFRPIKNARWLWTQYRTENYLSTASREVRNFIADLQLRHHFSLGVRGFAGAAVWLFIPTLLFAITSQTEGGAILVTILGGLCLLAVFLWLPFLQARFAAENRLTAFFELRKVRGLFNQAPIAWVAATIAVYALALPLYLLKVALVPRDALWFVTIVFIVSIYPARVLTGWAYSRAVRAERRAWFGWRWLSRLLVVPLIGLYVFLLFFTQFIGEHGKGVLFEHHAFLLPLPVLF